MPQHRLPVSPPVGPGILPLSRQTPFSLSTPVPVLPPPCLHSPPKRGSAVHCLCQGTPGQSPCTLCLSGLPARSFAMRLGSACVTRGHALAALCPASARHTGAALPVPGPRVAAVHVLRGLSSSLVLPCADGIASAAASPSCLSTVACLGRLPRGLPCSWSRDRPLPLSSRSLPLTATIFGAGFNLFASRQPRQPTLSMGWSNHAT